MYDYDDIPALRREEADLVTRINDARARLAQVSATPQNKREPVGCCIKRCKDCIGRDANCTIREKRPVANIGFCLLGCDGCGGSRACTQSEPDRLARKIGEWQTRLHDVRVGITEAYEDGR